MTDDRVWSETLGRYLPSLDFAKPLGHEGEHLPQQVSECVFCAKVADGSAEPYRGVYYFEPLNPVTPGHRLFISEKHFHRPWVDPAETGYLFTAATRYAFSMPMDFNLIVNAGPEAGQTIQHVHVHYVPRRLGDGLLMPWGGVHG